ncbi:DNA repair protein XRCC4 isoform X2 [Salminus brasiliensis]|uniref:DNA repair protein XRCC4 isoform X2 n=1 Tax=Salminus brasiliensis TaxID=930266 RepID=UPI003B835383
MMKVTVRQIAIDSKPESTFFLKLEWARDLGAGFVAVLCDGVSAWSGEVSEEDVTREAQEMEMPRERLGMVDLLPIPESTGVIKELISYGLKCSACLKAKNHYLLDENKRIRKELEHITTEMERYVRGKETLERDLYRRFVLVLNKKKTKLSALQERIKQLQVIVEEEKQRGKNVVADNEENYHTDKKLEEESDYGSTTDEEWEEDPKTSLNQKVLPSNPLNDSLHDITDVAPSRKRRQRHLQQLQIQTKRPTLEQRQRSRTEMPKEDKAEVKAPLQQLVQVSPDPDDLFDDI